MDVPISEIVATTARKLGSLGWSKHNDAVIKAADRMIGASVVLYDAEGQNLLHDAVTALKVSGLEFQVEAVFVERTATYLALDDVNTARYFASRMSNEVDRLIHSAE